MDTTKVGLAAHLPPEERGNVEVDFGLLFENLYNSIYDTWEVVRELEEVLDSTLYGTPRLPLR